MDDTNKHSANSIAIIGMAGRFPGANNLDQLWEALEAGRETIRHFTQEELSRHEFDDSVIMNENNYVGARGVLDDIELFDAGFFGYTPREAAITDPQQRVWLEIAWEALERAGYAHPGHDGAVGIFAGYLNSTYLMHNLLRTRADVENFVRTRYSDDFAAMLNNSNAYLATRTAYKLNLSGPAVNVQTACSTALVGVVMAVQSLLQFESDICIAGGITISVPQVCGYYHQEGSIFSKDGHCRPFDKSSSGTVFGSGAGAVVLKRLDEAIEHGDNILAVIRGAAINNDGANKVGFTAPSVDGQAEAISMAHYLADIDPTTITYVETHGTATPLGDPIEVAGLVKAFGDCDGKRQFCGLGSIKSNIGHLDAAAGIAGLIKTVLALQHRQIPKTVHFQEPNPNIDFESTPFFVVDRLLDWNPEGMPRRAGVSSFGVGGTNAHVVLEEAPEPPRAGPGRPHQLLLVSAKSEASLRQMGRNLADAFKSTPDLSVADAAWTLRKRRQAFGKRMFVVCDNDAVAAAAALEALRPPLAGIGQASDEPPKVALAFPGQGSHYHGMAEQLRRHEPVFREALEACCGLANRYIDFDLATLFSTETPIETYRERMANNGIAQLAIFSIDYSLARLWMHLGVTPDVLLGHSLGEWPAACIAGILSLEHAIEAVWHRGRLMDSVAGDGAALTVFADVDTVRGHLGEDVHLAAENAPKLTLVSGARASVARFQQTMEGLGIKCRELDITVAVHSPALDAIIAPFEAILRNLQFSPPEIPLVSTATGQWLTPEQAMDPAHWAAQMRRPVQFRSAVAALFGAAPYTVLETGPGTALVSLCRLQGGEAEARPAVNSLGKDATIDEHKQLLAAEGRLWALGVDLDPDVRFEDEARRTAPLPAYAFERQRHWVDPPAFSAAASTEKAAGSSSPDAHSAAPDAAARPHNRPMLGAELSPPGTAAEALLCDIWSEVLGIYPVGVDDDFKELGGDSLSAVRVMERIRKETGTGLPLNALDSAPTVARLAALVGVEETGSSRSACLVPVRVSGESNRPVLFVPHGAGGNVHWGYVNITAGFDKEQPVWGFEPPDGKLFGTFSEMAAFYIGEMKTLQPEGPYYLAGYCYGANLAYEIAYQLRARNETIAFLGMMEGWPENTGYGKIRITPQYIREFAKNVPIFAEEFLSRPLSEQRLAVTRRLTRWKRIALSLLEQKRAQEAEESDSLENAKRILLADMVDVAEYTEETAHVWENNLKILQEHNPEPCDAPMEIFRTRRQPLFSPHDPTMGWGALATGPIECHLVEGSHMNVVNPPYAEMLGRLLCERLKIAQEQQA